MICLYLHFWVWDARMSLLLKQTRKRSTYCCVIYVSYKTNCLKSFLLPYCFCINGFLLLQQVKEGVMRGQRCKWKYYYKNTYISSSLLITRHSSHTHGLTHNKLEHTSWNQSFLCACKWSYSLTGKMTKGLKAHELFLVTVQSNCLMSR